MRMIRQIFIITGPISKIRIIIVVVVVVVVQKAHAVSLNRDIHNYGIYYCDHWLFYKSDRKGEQSQQDIGMSLILMM
jgi:hypothetical protein